MTSSDVAPATAQYHPAVDAVLFAEFGPGVTVAELVKATRGTPEAILVDLLNTAACRAKWAAPNLESKLPRLTDDVQRAVRDVAHGWLTEIASGNLHQIPQLVATYHEALIGLGNTARHLARFRAALASQANTPATETAAR
jgi:hypothetical protein